jgi:hypothetical protein
VVFVLLVFDACRFELSAVHASASVSLVLSITTADDTITSSTRICSAFIERLPTIRNHQSSIFTHNALHSAAKLHIKDWQQLP